jgi:hypothetical protein
MIWWRPIRSYTEVQFIPMYVFQPRPAWVERERPTEIPFTPRDISKAESSILKRQTCRTLWRNKMIWWRPIRSYTEVQQTRGDTVHTSGHIKSWDKLPRHIFCPAFVGLQYKIELDLKYVHWYESTTYERNNLKTKRNCVCMPFLTYKNNLGGTNGYTLFDFYITVFVC